MLPKHLKVKKYRDKTPLFFKEKIETNFMKFLKLKSNYPQGDIS